ncbi:hypothetical protein EVAR_8254_1 [Eumeta japonica]|uniref:Uncharacterized protein n=1 Tax=Eumeta variegata TaxID=151549 RepID=A0A4C1TGT1_EUMVA|nr:hypothetical protein EVAR_8254_1 [Eumeta japonica]
MKLQQSIKRRSYQSHHRPRSDAAPRAPGRSIFRQLAAARPRLAAPPQSIHTLPPVEFERAAPESVPRCTALTSPIGPVRLIDLSTRQLAIRSSLCEERGAGDGVGGADTPEVEKET